jgi:cell fate regulator YaaT (PSP1 superfamily)
MKVLINLYSWENPRLCSSEMELFQDDTVIIEGDFGNDMGVVVAADVETKENPVQPILRKATARDIEAYHKNQEKKEEILAVCREEIKKLNLSMKLADAVISLDGGNVAIIFSAEERVDFRELVKSLSKTIHRSVRMHQIGSRDEARRWGGCGVCGRELCCIKTLRTLPSISIDTARIQQIAHRGSERISGQCGRLLCCLSFEAEQYKEMMKGMPEVGSKVKTKDGKGNVIELNALTQEVKVKLEDGKIVVVKKEDI